MLLAVPFKTLADLSRELATQEWIWLSKPQLTSV